MTSPVSLQKKIAQVLDRAASRADIIDAKPASSKQCWYLASLIARQRNAEDEYGDLLLNTSFVLTSRRASSMIDMYK